MIRKLGLLVQSAGLWVRPPVRLSVALSVALLAGCASSPRHDPLEPLNRAVFAFNEVVDITVVKPVATAYRDVVPRPVRKGVNNFFDNFEDAWSSVNNLLQGKVEACLRDVMRVGVNTFFGFAGVIDIATEMGLDQQHEDFGQTLGRWGLGPGPYLVWPLLGPSTVRDSVGRVLADRRADPIPYVHPVKDRNSLYFLRAVDTRSGLLAATAILDGAALDKYIFVREAYFQRRRSLVYDGMPPEDDEMDAPPEPPAPPSAEPAAPAVPADQAAPAVPAGPAVPTPAQ